MCEAPRVSSNVLTPSRTKSSCVHLPRPCPSRPRRLPGCVAHPQTVLRAGVYVKATRLFTLLVKRKSHWGLCAEHHGTSLPGDHSNPTANDSEDLLVWGHLRGWRGLRPLGGHESLTPLWERGGA